MKEGKDISHALPLLHPPRDALYLLSQQLRRKPSSVLLVPSQG